MNYGAGQPASFRAVNQQNWKEWFMKAVKVSVGRQEYYLAFNGEAMFAIRDKYGDAETLMEKMKPDTRESFEIVCDVIALLSEQGELVRRYYGYERADIIKAEEIRQLAQPADIIGLKMAIPRAIALGYGRDIEPEKDDEIDLGLVELNQKKTH